MYNIDDNCLAVDFEEESHTYLYNGPDKTLPDVPTNDSTMDRTKHRTIILPSVTQIISAKGFGAAYHNIPQNILQRASQIGIEVHKRAEDFFAKGIEPTSQDKSAEAYLQGFREFIALDIFKSVFTELRLMHPEHWYAGTIDSFGLLYGEPAVLDIKTTNTLHRESVGLQTAAYEILANRATGVDIKHRLALHLRKDGSWSLEGLRNPLDHGKFLSLLD